MLPSTAVCRTCLAVDVHLITIAGTPLQLIFEKLTNTQLITSDRRPVSACYLCHARLKQCHKFILQSARAENVLTDILKTSEITKITITDIDRKAAGLCSPLTITDHECLDSTLPPMAEVKMEKNAYNVIDEIYIEEGSLQPPYLVNVKDVPHSDVDPLSAGGVSVKEEVKQGSPPADMVFHESAMEHESDRDDNDDDDKHPTRSQTEAPTFVDHNVKGEMETGSTPPADMVFHESAMEHESDRDDNDDDDKHPTRSQTEAPTFVDHNVKGEMQTGQNSNTDAEDEDDIPLKSFSSKQPDHERGARETQKDGEAEPQKQAKQHSLGRDLRAKPGEKPNESDVCRTFTYTEGLKIYTRTHMGEEPFYYLKASECHVRTHSSEKLYMCKNCGSSFDNNNHLRRHLRTHAGEKPYKCDICNRQFGRREHLRRHFKTHTGEKPFKCDICERKFAEKGQLQGHMRTHTGEKPFECNICHQRFNQQRNLHRHNQRHTANDKPHKCDICQCWFTSAEKLKIHSSSHTEEKRFKCTVCQYSCQKQNNLKIHLMRHTGEKPYVCNICNRGFYVNNTLKVHLRSHTGEKPFECDYCQGRFSKKGHLQRHINIHTSDKIYTCSFCERSFKDKGSFQRHLRTHTGEKPFKCNLCEIRCNTTYDMKNHMMSHTGEKPFVCTVCQKRFSRKATLLKHSRVHTGKEINIRH